MLVDVWQMVESMVLSWQQVRSQREQSAGSLCPNRCPRDCCTSSGCAGACACASGGSGSQIARMSSCSLSRARRWFRTAQIRNLDVCEVVHEPGGVLAAAASGCEALSVPIKVERDMAR